MTSPASPRGFTLLETLIATGILVTALAGVAQLLILSSHLTRQANTTGAALVAAQEKLEILTGLPFDYDANGVAITDTLLEVSPLSSLDERVEPFVDWIGPAGKASATPDNSVFERRWRVSAIANDPPDAVTVEVCVFRMPARHAVAGAADVCLSTVRTRQP